MSKDAPWTAWVSPNRPTLIVSLGGFLAEIITLARHQGRDGLSFAILGLLWFWLAAGWVVWAVGVATAHRTRSLPAWLRLGARSLAMALPVAVAVVYLASWGLYLRTGRFANAETVKFILANPLPFADRQILRLYVVEAQNLVRWLPLLLLLPWLIRWMVRAEPTAGRHRPRRIIWYALTLAWTGRLLVLTSDPSELRRSAHTDWLKNCLNPVVTLVSSWAAEWWSEPITPCLPVAELVPIAAAAPGIPPGFPPNRPSIIFIKIESMRHDVVHLRHEGLEVMPHLNALARAGLQLTRAYSQTTHTDYSDVSVLSSLFPLRTREHHYYQTSDPWPKNMIYDLLQPTGYATALVSSQNTAWGRMDRFLETPRLDFYFDAPRSGAATKVLPQDSGFAYEVRTGGLHGGILDDQFTTDTALAWIAQQVAGGRPFFLAIDWQSSHFPYSLPAGSDQPFQPCLMDFPASFVWYPVDKTNVVRNAYYNALQECDRQLGRLVARLRELNRLPNTILVIYGDHGQAFHEHGRVNHAAEPIESVIRTATILYAPAFLRPRVEDYPVELIDLVPTTLALARLPAHPNLQGIDFLSPDRPSLKERLLFFHTETPLARTDAVLLAGRWKYSHDRMTSRATLFDLQIDPQETTDVALQEPVLATQLGRVLQTWRAQQLAYYHFPFYYEHYYPPPPPRWQQ